MPKWLTKAEETALVLKAQAGNREALGALIQNMAPLLWKKALKLAREHPPAEAEDLVQVGMTRIVESFHKFDLSRGARFSTYFGYVEREMRIHAYENGVVCASGLANGQHRPSTHAENRRHAGRLQSLDIPAPAGKWFHDHELPLGAVLQDTREPTEQGGESDLAEVIGECLRQLPDKYASVLEQRFVQSKTLEEIAEYERCTKENIRQRQHLALRALKELLISRQLIREMNLV